MNFESTIDTFQKRQIPKRDNFSEHNEKSPDYFRDLLNKTNNPEVRELILDDSESGNIQAVLLGIKPACYVGKPEYALQIKKELQLNDDFFVKEDIIFNKHLVIEIVKNNPEYFSDTELDAEKIIDRFMIHCDRSKESNDVIPEGLLLGFPKQAAEDFVRFDQKDTVRSCHALEEIIPKDSADWQLLQKLIKEESDHINKTYGENGEHPMRPPHLYAQVKELFYKYLPKELADISWDHYQGRFVKIGGVYWMEWRSSSESDQLKKKYASVLENQDHKNIINDEIQKLCRDLVNEDVRNTLDENNLFYISNLARKIKDKYSKRERALTLKYLLGAKFNSRNGNPIKSARDLASYLEQLEEEYKKEDNN